MFLSRSSVSLSVSNPVAVEELTGLSASPFKMNSLLFIRLAFVLLATCASHSAVFGGKIHFSMKNFGLYRSVGILIRQRKW